jgi:uncharacterized protein with von Willebrand factor type A (vWA) domain
VNDQEKELLSATLALLQASVNQLEMKANAVEEALKQTHSAFYSEYRKALDSERTMQPNALALMIEDIRKRLQMKAL